MLALRALGGLIGPSGNEEMAAQKGKNKPEPITIDLNGRDNRKGRLKAVGGSQSDDWNWQLLDQAVQALWVKHSGPEERQQQVEATVAALRGIDPQNELEGMLAAQIVAAHNAAMECYRRAMGGEQTFEGRRENLSQANKLSRTYVALLDALNRHRGKGQQKVTVEHVHVNAGGQAVVGVVESGGTDRKSDAQSEVKQIAHAPQPTVTRDANDKRESVPISGETGTADTGQRLTAHIPDDSFQSCAGPSLVRRE
ncbi:MAG: hypothetical protein WAM77_15965 [Xanthobacteraceae bacterium]